MKRHLVLGLLLCALVATPALANIFTKLISWPSQLAAVSTNEEDALFTYWRDETNTRQSKFNEAVAQLNTISRGVPGAVRYGACFPYSRDLMIDMKGDDVLTLQYFLAGKNLFTFTPNETSYFGPLTRTALTQFQTQAGITANGFFGAVTRGHISSLCSSLTTNTVGLQASPGDPSVNSLHDVSVSPTTYTSGVAVLSTDVKAVGGDVKIHRIPVLLMGTGAPVGEMIYDASLFANGVKIASTSVPSTTAAGFTNWFNFLNYTIPKDQQVEFKVAVTVRPMLGYSGQFSVGDKLAVALPSSEIVAVKSTGEAIPKDKITGGRILSEGIIFETAGPQLQLISTETSVSPNDGPNNDLVTFNIRFRVNALGDKIYISTSAGASTSGIIPGKTSAIIDRSGTATVGGVSVLLTMVSGNFNVNSAGLWSIDEDSSATFQLTGTAQLPRSGSAGQYRMSLGGLSWTTNAFDPSPDNVYNLNLDNFRTPYVAAN